jgi:GT2 family glycosyltransferase
MADTPLVDVVICSYKNRDLTIKCIDSVLQSTYLDYQIVVVDDYSQDGSAEYFRNKYPQIVVLENKTNLGAAPTRNYGINFGRAEYLVTLDNDATISPDWLSQMVELMQKNKHIGQAVGKILFFDRPDKIAAAGGSMFFRGKGYDVGFGAESDDPRYNLQRNVLYACSASMIIRRDVLEKIGGFYEGYYHGYEDTEVSLRTNLAGYDVIYYPSALSYHLVSATVENVIKKRKLIYLYMRNRLLIMLRNYEFSSLIKYLPSNFRFNLRRCLENKENIVPFILSLFSILYSLPDIFSARRILRNIRKVNDKQLEPLFNID